MKSFLFYFLILFPLDQAEIRGFLLQKISILQTSSACCFSHTGFCQRCFPDGQTQAIAVMALITRKL